jgi:hypothetical protein
MGRREFAGKIKKKSVTLLELLIAASIFSLVGAGIYKALSNSILIFRSIKKVHSEIDTLIFTEKLEHDLANLFSDMAFYFKGRNSYLQFFIPQSGQNQVQEIPVIKVEYVYNPQNKEIIRQTYSYQDDRMIEKKIVLGNVKKLSLRYYYRDNAGEFSKSVREIDRLPHAVEISLELYNNNSAYNAIIKVPVAG